MRSVGDAYDNAMAESFFATLECELLDRRRFKTQVEARIAVFEFIEGFYNPRRRHRSGICHPCSSRANLQRRPSDPAHTSMPSCSRPSRSGLEISQQAAPHARRPSLTAARHDSLGYMQAGTKRCSQPNQKIAQKMRTECSRIRTSVATSESDCARAPCDDLTRGDRIPGMA